MQRKPSHAVGLGMLAVAALASGRTLDAGEIRGRLLVGDRPAAGLTVAALPDETPAQEARRRARGETPKPIATASTRPDGTFTLNVAATPGGMFRVRAEGAGAIASWLGGTYDAAESDDLGEHALPHGQTLAGRVVTPTGAPVAGSEVTLLPRSGGPAADPDVTPAPRTTTTGADGGFRFDVASADGNRLTIETKGYGAASVAAVRAGTMARPISLGLGATFTGTVLKSDRKTPAVGALVHFEADGLETRAVETGADGSFRLVDLPQRAGTVVADGGDAGIGEASTGPLPLPPARRVTVVLSPPTRLQGRAVDAASRAAVPRVRITVDDGSRTRTTRSGPDGRYEVGGLLPQRSYRLRADEPRYAAYVRDGLLLATAETKRVDVPLKRAASISGRVVDEAGRPVGGALGRLFPPTGSGLVQRLRAFRGGDRLVFRTAADGRFNAARLEPGDDQRLTVAHPDFEPHTTGGLSLPPGSAKTLTVVLRRGLALVGRVHDDTGRPVAEASVQMTQARRFGGRGGLAIAAAGVGAGRGEGARPPATTAADGRFQVKGLAEGEYVVSVTKTGYADQTVDAVKVDAETHEPLEVTLSAGASIRGHLSRPDGRPAEGYWVRAVAPGGGPRVFGPGGLFGPAGVPPTGQDGVFSIDGLRAGETYDLAVFGPGGQGPRREDVSAPTDDLEIVVPGPGRIAGRVVDAQTQAPVTDFQVDFAPDRSSGRGGFGPGGRGGGRALRALAGGGAGGRGAQGVHSDDGTFVLDDVPAGTWEVVAQASGYQNARVGGLVIEEGGAREGVELRLAHGSSIQGRVLDGQSGAPILDASVTLQRPGGNGPRGLALLTAQPDAMTDADGGFAIEGLGPGSYTVVAHHPDFADGSALVEVKDGAATTEVRLTLGGSLAGIVLSEAGAPLPGAQVVLAPGGAGGGRGAGFGAFAGGQNTTTDDAGGFRFTHLAAGRYAVAASMRGHQAPPLDVLLQAGESRQNLTLSLAAGARIRGLVSGLPSSLRANVNVMANGTEGYFAAARAAADGSFELTGAPTGPVNLRASAGDLAGTMRSASTQVQVVEGQDEVTAEIVFETGFALSGTVTRSGQPVEGASVSANLMGGGGRTASARSAVSGAYRLEGLTQGTYSVAVASPGGGPAHRQTIEVSDDTTLDLAIPSARLAGVVVDQSSRQPLSEASVQAVPKDGGGRGPGGRGASTDSTGRFSLEDLDPTPYTVTVRRAGFQLQTRDVTPAETGGDDLTFELARGEGIGIEVRDAGMGFALRGVQVRATDSRGLPAFAGNVSLDSEGHGEIPSLPAGTYALALYASDYAPAFVAATAPTPRVLVGMTPSGSIEIHAGPATLANGTARLQVLTEGGQPYPFSFFAADGRVNMSAPIRRVDGLGPGRYLLQAASGQPQPFEVQPRGLTVVTLP